MNFSGDPFKSEGGFSSDPFASDDMFKDAFPTSTAAVNVRCKLRMSTVDVKSTYVHRATDGSDYEHFSHYKNSACFC